MERSPGVRDPGGRTGRCSYCVHTGAALLFLALVLGPSGLGVLADEDPAAPPATPQDVVAMREAAITQAVTTLNEGPEAHSDLELCTAVRLLRDLRATHPDAIWSLMNYLAYRFPYPEGTNEWNVMNMASACPQAGDALLDIGLPTVPYLVSRLAHTDDSGMRWGCLQLLAYLMGKHAIPVLESAIQQTPDPQAQARLRDILTRHRDYFVGGGCFMLPPPYRGPIPQGGGPTTP